MKKDKIDPMRFMGKKLTRRQTGPGTASDYAIKVDGVTVVANSDITDSHTYERRDSDIVFLEILMPHVNGLQVYDRFEHQNSKLDIVEMSVDTKRLTDALNIGLFGKSIRLA